MFTHKLSVFRSTSYLLPASRIELMDPVMNTYLSMYLLAQETSLASCSLSSALAVTTMGVGVGTGAKALEALSTKPQSTEGRACSRVLKRQESAPVHLG